MATRAFLLALAAATSMGLAACHKASDSDNGARQGAATGTTGVGVTGKGGGTSAMGGPGSGLAGGLNPAPGQSTGVSQGTTNSTPKNSVGNR